MCSAEVGSPEVLLFIECRQAAEATQTAPTRCQLDPTLLWGGCRGCPPPPFEGSLPRTRDHDGLPLSGPQPHHPASTHDFPSSSDSRLIGAAGDVYTWPHLLHTRAPAPRRLLFLHPFVPVPIPVFCVNVISPPLPPPHTHPFLNLHRTEESFALVSLME